MRFSALGLTVLGLFVMAGCATSEDSSSGIEDNITASGSATVKFTADFRTQLTGTITPGQNLVVEYAPERLPQCRGNIGGGGPAWNITGYYTENGGPAKMFEPTVVTPDNHDRVMKPVALPIAQGGDLAIWFEVHSSFGCQSFDSAFGQNYHFASAGLAPTTDASITFNKDGSVDKTGTLHGGGQVKVHYDQDRLPDCRRVQGGVPQWSITGFAKIDAERAQTFDTGRASGSDREAVDAIIDLPHSGELSLWFQVVDVGGCNKLDSVGGANYHFPIQ